MIEWLVFFVIWLLSLATAWIVTAPSEALTRPTWPPQGPTVGGRRPSRAPHHPSRSPFEKGVGMNHGPQSAGSLRPTLDFLRKHYTTDLAHCKPCVELKDVPKTAPYMSTKSLLRTTTHNGQLKLLLTEIEFLTDSLPSLDSPAIVVYAGSAPSHKYPFLRSMFPKVRFILVDPHGHFFMDAGKTQYDSPRDYLYIVAASAADTQHDTRPENRMNLLGEGLVSRTSSKQGSIPDDLAQQIENAPQRTIIIEDYMTDRLAELLGGLGTQSPLLFMSDIRSKLDEAAVAPSDLDIIWNSALMYSWVAKMKPARYMLKFRLPFGRSDEAKAALLADYAAYPHTHEVLAHSPIPFLKDFAEERFVYLKADHIWLQAFPGCTSAETRLVGHSLETAEYDRQDYEDRLFWYNRVQRSFGHHDNCRDIIDPAVPLDYCGDCSLARHIMGVYCAKYGPYSPLEGRSRGLDKGSSALGQAALSPGQLLQGALKAIGRNLKGDLHGCCHADSLAGWVSCLEVSVLQA